MALTVMQSVDAWAQKVAKAAPNAPVFVPKVQAVHPNARLANDVANVGEEGTPKRTQTTTVINHDFKKLYDQLVAKRDRIKAQNPNADLSGINERIAKIQALINQ